MSLPLKKLIINKLTECNNNSRKVIKYLKNAQLWKDITPKYSSDGETLYNFVYGKTKHCSENKTKFVSFSVGYVFCGKANTCQCAKDSVSDKVKQAKLLYNDEKKKSIKQKRQQTNIEKFGVANPFSDTNLIQNSLFKKYGVTNPRQIESVNEKIKQTNLSRYGVDNPAKNQDIKEKQVKTWKQNSHIHIENYKNSFLEKHGVTNPRQIESVNEKIKQTNLSRYGVDNPAKNHQVREKISKNSRTNFFLKIGKRVDNLHTPGFSAADYKGTKYFHTWICNFCGSEFYDRLINGRTPICRKCYPYSQSEFENQVYDFVTSITSQKVIRNDKQIISPYELDIVIPDSSLAIECNGVYWHSELNGKHKNYHLNKTNLAKQQNYRLIHLTDINWKEKQNICKSIIRSAVGKNKRIYARTCEVNVVEKNKKDTFLQENHIQGTAPSSVNISLTHNGRIVALMTFGKSRFNKSADWELIRYCQELNTTVVGGAAKLFAHFEKLKEPVSVISYADKSIFSGVMYEKLNFKYCYDSSPGYKYFNKKQKIKLENRIKYQKHKLPKILSNFNTKLTEWENMVSNNYDRYWDCGNSVWLWKK